MTVLIIAPSNIKCIKNECRFVLSAIPAVTKARLICMKVTCYAVVIQEGYL